MNRIDNANSANAWMADMYSLLKMNNWQGRTARLLLGADIVLWSLLIYFIVDYQLFFAV